MLRTLILSIAAIALLAAAASPASAAGACVVSSPNGTNSEWTGEILKRTNVGCRAAKRVVRRCGRRNKVKGWKLKLVQNDSVFSRKGKRFHVRFAGAAPKCVAYAYSTTGEG